MKRKNHRIDKEQEELVQKLKNLKERRKAEKKQHKLENPGKIKRTLNLVSDNTKVIFSSKSNKKNIKIQNAPKGILAEQAEELAEAMKNARSKNELFQLARLMKAQAKQIQDIARKI